jgi:hypothetical protein
MSETDTRPFRLCEACGQVDDHPRHVVATAPGDGATPPELAEKALNEAAEAGYPLQALLLQLRDDAVLEKHMDCCAADGCETCAEQLSVAGDDNHGLALAKALSPKDGN